MVREIARAGPLAILRLPCALARVYVWSSPEVPFVHVEQDVTFPMPRGNLLEAYVVYVGFDPAPAKPERKQKQKQKQKRK